MSKNTIKCIYSQEIEEWRDITIGNCRYREIYQISSFGRVRCNPFYSGTGYRPGKMLYIGKSGKIGKKYPTVRLCKKCKHEAFTVHRLVAHEFLGKRYGNQQINHIDGNRENNYLSNLEYISPSENIRHAYRISTDHGYVFVFNERLGYTEAVEKYGVCGLTAKTFGARIARGWNVLEALRTEKISQEENGMRTVALRFGKIIKIKVFGDLLSLKEAIKKHGVKDLTISTLRFRLKNMSVELALKTPVRRYKKTSLE